VILVALLFFLSIILRQLFVGGGGLPIEEISLDEGIGDSKPEFPAKDLYPPVPAVSPELSDNYLFNSERSFEDDGVAAGPANGAVDLAEVTFTGSLIVGQIRIGLITYQDDVAAAPGTPAATSRRGQVARRARTKSVTKNRQLAAGENFMGYSVEAIEKDRIVFKKGDEMIEKFLYDSGKDRSGVGEVIRSQPGQTVTVPGGRTVPPVPARQPADERHNNLRPGNTEPAANNVPSNARTIRSRSELLRGLDPSLGAYPSPGGGPGDPLRR
jgi:hypothetical protein